MNLTRFKFNDPADPATKAFVIVSSCGDASIEFFAEDGKALVVWLQRPMLEKLAEAIGMAVANRDTLVTAPGLLMLGALVKEPR